MYARYSVGKQTGFLYFSSCNHPLKNIFNKGSNFVCPQKEIVNIEVKALIAIYSRKSKYTGKGESIENQIQLCREYAEKYLNAPDNEIAVYEDEGFSGGNTKRPEFQRMLKDVKQNKISTLICYRLDRISRNVADFSNILEMLIQHHVNFVSIRESFDTSTPMGKAMVYISSVFAQLERETIAERIRDNMYELAKTGRWLGGAAPLGFQSKQVIYTDEDGKNRKYNVLAALQEEKEVVKLLYSEFVKLGSISKLQKFAYTHGLKTRNGKDFHINCLKSLLANPVYCVADKTAYQYLTEIGVEIFSSEQEFDSKHGLSCYNKTSKDNKKITRPKDYSEWIVAVAKHEGMVESKVWIKAQKIIANNRNKAIRQVRNPKALLSGLLFCKECGAHMRPKYHNAKGTSDDDRKYYYICEMKEKSKKTRCKVDNINGNFVDELFVRQLKEMAADSFDFAEQFQLNANGAAGTESETDMLLKGAQEKLQETNSAIGALLDNLSQGSYDKSVVDVIMEQVNALTEKRQAMEQEIAALQAQRTSGAEVMKAVVNMKDTLSIISTAFDSLTMFEQRDKLRILVDKILWDGESIEILLRGA